MQWECKPSVLHRLAALRSAFLSWQDGGVLLLLSSIAASCLRESSAGGGSGGGGRSMRKTKRFTWVNESKAGEIVCGIIQCSTERTVKNSATQQHLYWPPGFKTSLLRPSLGDFFLGLGWWMGDWIVFSSVNEANSPISKQIRKRNKINM